MSENTFDVVVIGAGPVGENIADRVASGGLSVAIIESELVGGECSYWACMPSKALLRSGAALSEARAIAGSREAVSGSIDVQAVLARRDSFTSHWDDSGQRRWLEGVGATLFTGHGALAGKNVVTVTTADGLVSTLHARYAVALATGSSALLPPVPGLAEATPWTSREATSAQHIPRRLVILGGGVVGVEMATAFSSLGSEVTLIARSRVLSAFEPFASEATVAALREAGVQVLEHHEVNRVTRTETVEVELAQGGSVVADEIVVATGRTPRTQGIGLETVGLKDGDWISTDDALLAILNDDPDNDWLYACGDVNHRALLTHQGKYQARAVGDAIVARAQGAPIEDRPWGRHVATADNKTITQVVFGSPEIVAVGLTAHEAKQQLKSVRVVDYNLGYVAGASLFADGYAGAARMIVDVEQKRVVGATFVGPGVAELSFGASAIIAGELPLDRLWHVVPAYPTISEVWLRLLEQYGRDESYE